jgi:hypothetical protein
MRREGIDLRKGRKLLQGRDNAGGKIKGRGHQDNAKNGDSQRQYLV